MRSRKTKVCRWCLQPLPEWTDIWPHEPGVYLFYGYPVSKEFDRYPRLVIVTVEGYSDIFGTIYRTPRSTLKKQTGAAGYFMPLLVPAETPAITDLESLGDEAAAEAAKLKIKRVKKNLRDRKSVV